MLRHKLHRLFPVFFAYICFQIFAFGVLFPMSSQWVSASYQLFFWSYWACAAVNLVLGFMIIYEIFLDVFRPYYTLKDLGSVLFKWAALVMSLVAFVVAASSPTGRPGADRAGGDHRDPLRARGAGWTGFVSAGFFPLSGSFVEAT